MRLVFVRGDDLHPPQARQQNAQTRRHHHRHQAELRVVLFQFVKNEHVNFCRAGFRGRDGNWLRCAAGSRKRDCTSRTAQKSPASPPRRPPSSRSIARASPSRATVPCRRFSSSKTVSTGTTALAAVPRTNCAKESSRRINSRCEKITKPTANNGRMVTPSGFAESESNQSPPKTASSGDNAEVRVQGGINHKGRQQINLRAEQVPQAGQRGLAKHREKRGGKNQDGVQHIHGNSTQTCSRAPRLAESFTRASV